MQTAAVVGWRILLLGGVEHSVLSTGVVKDGAGIRDVIAAKRSGTSACACYDGRDFGHDIRLKRLVTRN